MLRQACASTHLIMQLAPYIYGRTVVEINFIAGSMHLLPGAKLTNLLAKIVGRIIALMPSVLVVVRLKTKQNTIHSKALTVP